MDHPCSPPVSLNDELTRDRIVTRSLAERGDYLLIGMSLLGGAWLSAVVCFPHRLGWTVRYELGAHTALFAVAFVVLPLVFVLLMIGAILTPWRRGLELRWLGSLPFPFAHQGYLRVLKRESSANNLQLLLTFDQQPKPEQVKTLCELRLPGSKVVWQDERCVLVQSPRELETKGRGVSSNARLHRWFRRAAAPFFTTLHRDGGLKKVEVRS